MKARSADSTQVLGRPDDDGLSAHCSVCDASLELQRRADVAAALASFDAHHPTANGTSHSPGLPWGWRPAVQEGKALSR